MKKKILQRSLALGALMAFAITGSALAANFEDGIDRNEVLDQSGYHNVGIIAPTENTTVDKDVSYKFILNQGAAITNSGVSTVYVYSDGNSITFNRNLEVFLSTNLTGTGNNSANGLCVYAGNLNFKGDTEVTVEAKGENGKSAYGISVLGDADKNIKPVLNFTGDNLTVHVITDTARQGDPIDPKNKYCEAAGISVYNADVITATSTKAEINVEGTSTTNKATPVYGLLNEAGVMDFKGDTVINVTTHGIGSDKDVMENKDRAGLAVGVKVIDGFYNTTLGNQSGRANTILNNAVISAINTAEDGRAVAIQTTDFDIDNSEFAQLEINGNLTANVDADTARGLEIKNGTYAKIGGSNTENIIINVKSSNVSTSETVNAGILAATGGKIEINTDSLVVNTSATGVNWAYGISAQNNTVDATSNIATVNINADTININSTAETEGHASGLVTMSQGIMNVNGNLTVTADDAIVARGDSIMRVNEDGKHSTKLDGDIDFNYDEKTSGTKVDADVLVNLTGADSYWNGNAKVSWGTGAITPEEKAQVTGLTLILADGAQWNPTVIEDSDEGESGVTSIAINQLTANDGIINIKNGAAANIDTINGSGGEANFEVDDNLTGGILTIRGGGEGTTIAANYSVDADKVATKENFAKLVENTLHFDEGAGVTGIAYVDEGLLTPAMSAVTKNDISGNTIELQDIQQASSTTTMDAMRNIASTAIIAWRQEDSTLSQRLGELRNSEGDQGVWVRMSRGEFEYSGAYKNQYNYFQMGYDKAYGAWHYGAAISHNDGQTAYANGKGDNRSTSLSLYGTWLGASGQYADIVLKQGRLSNEFEIHTAAGDTRGDYDAWGTSLSGEYGVKMDMSDGWYVTPQAQLTFMRIGGEDYTTSNNIRVSQDTLYSTVGRVGFELGKNITDKGSVYAKASLLHEFAGDADTYLRLGDLHNSYSQDIGDTWYEAGLGFNYKTGADSYVYADVVKTFGDDIKTPWQWNVGMRWSF